MDFTREPIIESVITPKEGCKLVIRSSKSAGQEEFFVDVIELVSFGSALFFRSLERPKAFMVPVSDYEVLEVRETRMVLKAAGGERAIKIAGGRTPKEAPAEKIEHPLIPAVELSAQLPIAEEAADSKSDAARGDKRRDRRRQTRRRRESPAETVVAQPEVSETEAVIDTEITLDSEGVAPRQTVPTILPPPSTLISETIARYRNNDLFSGAFYLKEGNGETQKKESSSEEEEPLLANPREDLFEEMEIRSTILEPSEYGSLDIAEERIQFAEEGDLVNEPLPTFSDEDHPFILNPPSETQKNKEE